VLHLYTIELAGYKRSDVQTFVNKVRYVLVNLRTSELTDKDTMYEWLYEKFKGWGAISHEIRSIRRANANSRKRTWKFL